MAIPRIEERSNSAAGISRGLPHQCAHWFAMTWKFLPGPSFGGAVRTPREGCPYGKTCRAVGLGPPLRVLMESSCRDTRPRVSPTLGRVDPDTPGGVSLQISP